jgi:hypothetical protein
LQFQRPLGIAAFLADQLDRSVGDGGILEHQQMGVDENGNVRACPAGNTVAYRDELEACGFQGTQVALDFLFDQPGWYGAFQDLYTPAQDDMRLADGNAAGNSNAVQHEAHILIAILRKG